MPSRKWGARGKIIKRGYDSGGAPMRIASTKEGPDLTQADILNIAMYRPDGYRWIGEEKMETGTGKWKSMANARSHSHKEGEDGDGGD